MSSNSLQKPKRKKSTITRLQKKPKSKKDDFFYQEKKRKIDAEEKRLEHVVLGDESLVIERLNQSDVHVWKKKKEFHDFSGKSVEESDVEESDDDDDDDEEEEVKRKPAWDDDDDEKKNSTISTARQTSRFVSETPKWAQLNTTKKTQIKRKKRFSYSDDDDDDDDDDDNDQIGLAQSTGNYLASSSAALPSSVNIQVKRCSNLNRECSNYDLSALEFHSKSTVALTAGSDFRFHLFQVDGEHNRKIHSVLLERFAIQCGHFSADGNEIIFGSGHKYFCYFNLESAQLVRVPTIKNIEEHKMSQFVVSPDGRFIVFLGASGYMHLLSARSKEHLSSLKMNGSVSSVAFSPDGTSMYSFGSDGQVYVWDMDSRRCVHRFYDDGCVKGTCIAVSPNNKYLACGSDTGVVNVYNMDICMADTTPQPRKALMKLTTACTSLKFNHTSELLATASNRCEKGVKLVHLPTFSTFRDFPDRMDKAIHFPIAMDISPNSGYLTIGTNKGRALLYRLKHYSSY